ncbi:MAG: FAD-dependent oxidoreductase [Geminocystis sp.]|nr:FAD-dependent oxidoreductase [Geminocystis sp.]HIK36844.1 FAD-dependent oxidoreductase [Geminocystis sp. M7585_C2015_104]
MEKISRRSLLKLSAIASILGAVGYSRVAKPKPTIHVWDNLQLPTRVSQPKRVVVIGGGLAGLACAYELGNRGFEVILLEKSPQLGGKIASWQIQVGEEKFTMEHGFHGFFPQYYNLWSIVREIAIEKNFQSLNFYSLLFKDNKYKPEVFRPSHSSFPWNVVDLAISSPNFLSWGIDLTNPGHWGVFRAITSFKIPDTYNSLDHISVTQWATNIPQGLFDLYFLPFGKSTLNAPDLLSAGELMQFFHFYFFGNPEGLAFNGTVDDMGRSLVTPIAQSILHNGGKIITEAHISRIVCENGRITSLQFYRGGQGIGNVPFWVDSNPYLRDDYYDYYGAGDQLFAVAKDNDLALSLSCTHQGCVVSRQEDGSFICPCHGAVYNQKGEVKLPPAKRNLAKYRVVEREEGRVKLVATDATPAMPETLTADYYVIATDVRGVKHLFRLIEGDRESYPDTLSQVESLALADPFAVARFWLDRDFYWPHSNFTSLSGYRLTDSITLYHRIQREYKEWAEKTGGSVVELHAYCYKEKDFPTQTDLLNTFKQELIEIVPELAGAKILHQQLVNQKNFSGYPPNSYKNRPETETQIANLVFAGDWVKMPFPCGLMERAVSSGLLAANAILHKEGLKRRNLFSVNPSGFFSI